MTSNGNIPVFRFNEHHEAFYYWHLARGEGCLQEATDLVHIDAHDDMAQPKNFSESIYPAERDKATTLEFYRRFASTQLTIADFIFPAVLSRVVHNVYFVYPPWRKFKSHRKVFTICSAFGEGKILKYGIKLNHKAGPLLHKTFPDLVRFQYFAGEVHTLPQNRKVLLDIDLDYFACRDSITNHMSYELEITRAQFHNQELFLKDKTLPFSGLDIEFFKRDEGFFVQIKRKKLKEVSYLPSKEEIEQAINALIAVLARKKIKPAAVTICRSCDSGYCPREKVQYIELLLLKKLQPLLS